jgi:hypothetical protein
MTTSYAFANILHTLKLDFSDAIESFKRNPNAVNFNRLTETALAYQQGQWLGMTPQITALRLDLTAKKIVMGLPSDQWGKAVVDCAAELTT